LDLPKLRTAETDLLYRCLADEPPLRAVVVVATSLVRDAVARHHLEGAQAVALGRGLLAGLLLATVTKGGERVTAQILGEGGSITVDANDLGQVRGYLAVRPSARRAGSGASGEAKDGFGGSCEAKNGSAEPGPAWRGRIPVAPLLGSEGRVVVHRDLGLKEIYQGTCSLASGEIDEDIQRYLVESEQMPSVIRAAVLLDEAGAPSWAGGVLVQTTPGASAQALEGIASRVENGWVERDLRGADELLPMLEDLLDQPAWILEWRRVEFHCPCDSGRVAAALRTLGVEDLRGILAEEGRAEVTCHFCGRVHRVETEALASIIKDMEALPNEAASPQGAGAKVALEPGAQLPREKKPS
jgi:molecular chaperone Hsp33